MAATTPAVAAEPAALDLFGILQSIASAADSGKPMTVDDVVDEFGNDAAKEARAERKAAVARAAAEAGMEAGGEAAGDAAGSSQPLILPSKSAESFVLFCGGRGSGKSALLHAFLGSSRSDSAAASSALEYAYGRKSAAAGDHRAAGAKDVAHCWELAGGTRLQTLTQVPLTAQRISSAAVVLCASLDRPCTVLPLLLRWLPLLRARCDECLAKLRKKAPRRAAHIVDKAARRSGGPSHPDAELLSPLPVPTFVVLTHFDRFQDQEPARRRALLSACRYVAHVHGAHLLCTSTADRALTNACRSALSSAVFGTDGGRAAQHDVSRAVLSPPGSDRFADMDLPRGMPAPTSAEHALGLCPGLLAGVDSVFPRVGTAAAAQLEAADEGLSAETFESWRPAAKGPLDGADADGGAAADLTTGFEEPEVDAAVSRRSEELQRYAKEAARRVRLNAERVGALAGTGGSKKASAASSSSSSRRRRKE